MPKSQLLAWLYVLVSLITAAQVTAQFSCSSVKSIRCNTIASPICNPSSVGICAHSLPNPDSYNQNILPLISNDLCTSNAFDLQNPNWFTSVATSTTIEFVLDVQFCNGGLGGDGVQYAVIRGCGDDLEVIYCSSSMNNGIIDVSASDMRIGESFYVLIDGFGGSVCTYSLRGFRGFGVIDIDPIADIDIVDHDDQAICFSDAELDFILLDDDGDPSFGVGSLIVNITDQSGQSILDAQSFNGNGFTHVFDQPGSYTVEVAASNDCSTEPVTFVKTITVIQPEDQILDPFVFCSSEFGTETLFPDDLRYLGPPISQEDIDQGQLIHQVNSANGCSYNQIVDLILLDSGSPTVIDTVICGSAPVDVLGTNFANSVSDFELVLPGLAQGGCDSIILLDLTIGDVSGEIDMTPCPDGSFVFSFVPDDLDQIERFDSIFYRWVFSDDTGTTSILSVKDDLVGSTVNSSGDMTLIMIPWKNDMVCTQENLIESFTVEPFELNLICDVMDESTLRYTWDALPNATQYLVVNAGDTISRQVEVGYTFENLELDQTISLEIFARGNSRCGDFVDGPIDCQASACPSVDVSIAEDDLSFCLDGGTSQYDFEVTIADHDGVGSGLWMSNGIIDTETGVFDIQSSGVGQFFVEYIYVIDGRCTVASNRVLIDIDVAFAVDFAMQDVLCLDEILSVQIIDFQAQNNYRWESEGSPEISQITDELYELEWDAPGSYSVALIMEQEGCDPIRQTRIINVQPSLAAIELDCDASMDRILFSWIDDPLAMRYEVLDAAGNVLSAQSESTYQITDLAIEETVSIEIRAYSDNGCPFVSSGLQSCATTTCASISFAIDQQSQSVCHDGSQTGIQFTLSNEPTTGTGTWSVDNNGIIDPATGFFDFGINATGTYTVQYTHDTGACSYQSENSVMINLLDPEPFSYSISDVSICSDESIQLTVVGFDSSIDFDIDAGEDAIVEAINDGVYQLSWSAPGDKSLLLSTQNSSCASTEESFDIEVLMAPDDLDFNCLSAVDRVQFTWEAVACASAYDVSVNGSPFSNQSEPNITIDGLVEGQEVQIEVIAIGDCQCGMPMGTVQCIASSCPARDIELDIASELCEGSEVSVMAILDGEDVSAQGQWSTNVNSLEFSLSADQLIPGTNEVSFDIEIDGCQYQVNSSVELLTAPELVYGLLPDPCSSMTTLELPFSVDLDMIDIFIDEVLVMSSSTVLSAGTYDVRLVDKMTLCTTEETLVIIDSDHEELNVDLAIPPSVVLGESLNFDLTTSSDPSIDAIEWILDSDVICDSPSCSVLIDSLAFQGLASVELCIEMQYSSSCSFQDCRTIEILDTQSSIDPYLFYIPNVFSCNAINARNRVFSIQPNDPDVIVLSVLIYDRFGGLRYSSEVPNQETGYFEWDGKDQSSQLVSPGVYMYKLLYIDRAGRTRRIFGSVTFVN